MSNQYDINTPEVANGGEINAPVIILNEFGERGKDRDDVANIPTTAATSGTAQKRKICLVAKLQCLFFAMKIFGLFYEEYNTTRPSNTVRGLWMCTFTKRLYQLFVLLVLWLNVGRVFASFWLDDKLLSTEHTQAAAGLLWSLQTAIQASICVYTMQITSKKSPLKSLLLYWNSQPNFDELVVEPFMVKCVRRTLIVTYIFMMINAVFYGLVLFYPSESMQYLARAFLSPFPLDNLASKILGFVISAYCTAAWVLPFAIFTAICLTLIHQCRSLRKTLRLTALASEVRRVKILRQQHSSLCGSVRKVHDLFKFVTLVVYVTNIPLVCFLLYRLMFDKNNDATTYVILTFWSLVVLLAMMSVSFLGAHLNSKIHSFTEVVQKVEIANVDLDTHTELMLFVAKLNGDPVAITAGGLVPITKPLIVTVLYISYSDRAVKRLRVSYNCSKKLG